MSSTKKYWKGLPELNESPEFLKQSKSEFSEEIPMEGFLSEEKAADSTSRRDFLKLMGFTTTAAVLASCETPVIKSIPYVVKPEDVTPGVANFYASTFYDGHDYSPVLVKTREGRPIKIEGNEKSEITGGGTSARVQSSVLSLYDSSRLTGPVAKNGTAATWKNVDSEIAKRLSEIAKSGKEIAILSSTIISPSTERVIAEFKEKYKTTKLYQYDAISYSALRNSNEKVFGKKEISSYDFSKAKNVIVGFACDFLGTWLNPVEFAYQYSKTRKVTKENPSMSKHYHFEANMSLTGANADERFRIRPSDIGKAVVALYNAVAKKTGSAVVGDAKTENESANKAILKIADELVAAKGSSLVVCGSNDVDIQVLINGINQMLDNYGKTIDLEIPLYLKKGDDEQFIQLVSDMNAGKVAAILTYNCNPVYTSPAGMNFSAAYAKVGLKISFSQSMDETSEKADFVCPDNHYLESWGDANPKRGHYSFQQPAINQLFTQPRYEGTRQFQDSILTWAGVKTTYYAFLQAYWQYKTQNSGNFYSFWNKSIHDGVLKVPVAKLPKEEPVIAPLVIDDSTGQIKISGIAPILSLETDSTLVNNTIPNAAVSSPVKEQPKNVDLKNSEIKNEEKVNTPSVDFAAAAKSAASLNKGKWELMVYEKVGLGNGNQSNNPWLMELPDPISKVTWDNYITMSPEDIEEQKFLGMKRQDIEASVATVKVNGVSFDLPVYPQPGQAKGTIGIAYGYGRTASSLKVCNGIGANAYQVLSVGKSSISSISCHVDISSTDKTHQFAATQIHHTIMGREEFILRETSLTQYKADPKSNNPEALLTTHTGPKHVNEIDLWADHERPNHKWAMVIDMNSCIGCGACVVACTAENNVAVVGKDQVMRTREMHWLRIDRYYSSDMTRQKAAEEKVGAMDMYLEMENASNNPKVTFQPMMCQHCNHAPCETVCPVLATSHSTEGVNMMTYNRCIGTRYCANNCPFKVRRFNWYNYNDNPDYAVVNPAQSDLGRMVLNPDVTVRGRGVMEKCSMCAQRTQEGKLKAKKAGKPLEDMSIKTACQQSCPTNAIVFGDANDEKAQVSGLRKDERNYYLLEELGVKPNISYLVKVRNQEEEIIWEVEEANSTPNHEKKEA